MTRRENTRNRRSAHLTERSIVLVVCGAESTEPQYLRGLKKWLHRPSLKLEVKKKGGADPGGLVRYAAKIRDHSYYDEVWCVTDVDEYNLADAVAQAKRSGIQLAISNPCFEYWLLLHFEDCRAYMEKYEEVKPRLRRYVPGYDKTSLHFNDFSSGVLEAVKRAERGCPDGWMAHEINPSTGIWRLVSQVTSDGE